MSEAYDYDLVVIGAGSGGVRLARVSAGLGARVAIVERGDLGGTCVNVGCVPKKLFVYASHVREDVEDAAGYGFSVAPEAVQFNWRTLRENKDTEIQRLNGIYQRLLDNAGVDLYRGNARVTGPNEVSVDNETLSARRITVATGSTSDTPAIPGREHLHTSDDMFYLDQLPEKAVVWGGGYIAVEFAGILAGLGVETTLIYRGELFLRGFDGDVRRFLAEELPKKGVTLRFNTNIDAVEASGDSAYQVRLNDGSTLEAGLVLAATGRKPLVEGLGLEAVGVELNETSSIRTDRHFQTSVPSIHALGDVIGTPQLTPVAIEQAMVLSDHLFGEGTKTMDYRNIPSAVFCQPPIGTVGLTEEDAREECGRIRVYRTHFKPMKHTLSGRDERILMKLIVDDDSDRVVGAHMVGPDAGEMMQGIAVALKAGATKADFDQTIGIHPTSAEEFVTMRDVSST
ncbi:NADPH-glutathione reductase [Halospina denitrificans]|uniref:NADPH-glutathione reductase n=1 Tax=Halospina denitrificans TaxID=332522 RepID=A0A4R7JV81_9GAMM|nr:glutathione-disulfide reductase [Halospina denitrificans]TDT41367.1 NADPH-glutathione reductase [Halospina denitrificans]